jgi:hypothetical protein
MNTLRLRLSVVNGLDQPLAPANLDEIALLDTSAQKRPPGVVAEAQLFDVDPIAPVTTSLSGGPVSRAESPNAQQSFGFFCPPAELSPIYKTQWLT